VEFVRNIRHLYPESDILCILGGMNCYHESAELRTAFEQAVEELKNTDPKVRSLVFKAFSPTHPRVDTHRKLAAELTAFLKKAVI
jgi:hypothetical protein